MSKSDEIKFNQWLQSRLTSHGFPVGLIDGLIGPVTTRALTAFQNTHGLAPTSVADPATVAALQKSSSAVVDKLPVDRDRDTGKDLNLVKQVFPKQSGMRAFYGEPGTGMARIEVPFDMYLAWDKSTRLRVMTVHQKCAESATRALQAVSETYSSRERADIGISLFGGSLNIRRMRGGTQLSTHAYGAAIDFDPERNQLKWNRSRARLAEADATPFWDIWQREGWLSLGRARDFDWMHVQAARLG